MGIMQRKLSIIANKPHLVTVTSGNTQHSDIVASFTSPQAYALKDLTVNLPYNANGYSSVTVTRSGKNMFDISKMDTVDTPVTDGVVTGTARNFYNHFGRALSASYPNDKMPIRIEGNKHIYWSFYAWNEGTTDTRTGLQPFWKYMDNTVKVAVNVSNQTQTPTRFWCHSATYYSASPPMLIGISFNAMPDVVWHWKMIQIELGGTLTDFEEFKGNHYTATFSSIIYGGHADLINGTVSSEYASDGTALSDPVVSTITAQSIPALAGLNNIWSSAGTVSVQYWTH